MEKKNGLQRLWDFLNHPIIQLAGGSGVFAVITWTVTHIAELPVWEIWLAIVFAIGCWLWIVNQIGTWRERHKKRLYQYNDKEVEELVRRWVDIPAFSFRRQEVEPGLFFKFLLTDQFDRNVTIIRDKNDSPTILVLTEMTYGYDPHQKEPAWELLADKLSLELARLGVQFLFNGDTIKLQRVRIIEPVLIEDSLTGFYFRQRVMLVIRALVLAGLVGKQAYKEMGIIPPSVGKADSQPGPAE